MPSSKQLVFWIDDDGQHHRNVVPNRSLKAFVARIEKAGAYNVDWQDADMRKVPWRGPGNGVGLAQGRQVWDPAHSVELTSVVLLGYRGAAYTFRVWALRDPRVSPRLSIYFLGPIAGGPFVVSTLGPMIHGLNLGSSNEGRFVLSPQQAADVVAEAKCACFEHEDCRASAGLGRSCRLQGRASGRASPSLVPPADVRRNTAEGLDLVRDGFGGRGLTDGALRRAWALYRGHAIDLARARMMRGWFARHAVDKRPGWKERATPGWVAWQLWGGDAGRRWVEGILRRA